MTRNRRPKRAIRSRMSQTGEKYTEARRALLTLDGDSNRGGEDPDITFAWPDDSLGWFTDQAYNLILLAEDEARMLNHPMVEPEHLLLATTRRGNVQRLLGGNPAHSIHTAIVQIKGFGNRLELRPRRSPASKQVLVRAVTAAAARGILGPSSEHLLLAPAEHELPARILAGIGVPDTVALVDATYPVTRPRVNPAIVQRRAAQLLEIGHTPPSPGPIPPIFERFTTQARDAINDAVQYARRLDDPYVEPFHLLVAFLGASGIAATLRNRFSWEIPPMPIVTERRHGRATDIFSTDARRIVAEDVLIVAERIDHRALTTGHLLTALLERADERSKEIIHSLPGSGKIAGAVIEALTGEETF